MTGTACGLGISGIGLDRAAERRRHERARRRRDERRPCRPRRGEDARRARRRVRCGERRRRAARPRPAAAGRFRSRSPTRGPRSRSSASRRTVPFTATPARIGQTGNVLTDDAYGRGPISRQITTLRGLVRQRQLGRAGSRRGRPRADDDLRRADRLAGRLRRAESASSGLHWRRPATAAVSTGPCVR